VPARQGVVDAFSRDAGLLALLLTWFAERRPWPHALAFGLIVGGIVVSSRRQGA
jgi:hypothetical protein